MMCFYEYLFIRCKNFISRVIMNTLQTVPEGDVIFVIGLKAVKLAQGLWCRQVLRASPQA